MGEKESVLEDLAADADALNNLSTGQSICIGRSRLALCQFPDNVIVNESMWKEIFCYCPPLDVAKCGPAEYEIKSIDGKMRMVVVLDSEWTANSTYLKADVADVKEMQTPDCIEPALRDGMPADIRFYKAGF